MMEAYKAIGTEIGKKRLSFAFFGKGHPTAGEELREITQSSMHPNDLKREALVLIAKIEADPVTILRIDK